MKGKDIPIVQLVPLTERKVRQREIDRITASIQAVGLLEPLVVFPEEDHYVILDGRIRYQILLQMGIETVPCIIWKEKEAFTANRMVNRLSPVQEARMINQSLQELDEPTIASALALTRIVHRLNKSLLKRLSPRVAAAFDTGKITKVCAREFTFVKPARQEEILGMMEEYNDCSVAFARTLILKTPPVQRAKPPKGTKTPWDRSKKKKSDLLKQLKEAEEKHDFYSTLYRQYSINLLKLVIYVRSLVTHERAAECMRRKHPDILAAFQEVITHAEG